MELNFQDKWTVEIELEWTLSVNSKLSNYRRLLVTVSISYSLNNDLIQQNLIPQYFVSPLFLFPGPASSGIQQQPETPFRHPMDRDHGANGSLSAWSAIDGWVAHQPGAGRLLWALCGVRVEVGYPLVMSTVCYWKWLFIVEFPIKNGDFPYLC